MGNRLRDGLIAGLTLAILAGGLILAGAAKAQTDRTTDLHIPPGSLANALSALARQTGIDIGGSDPELARVVTRGVEGRRTPERALAELLRSTPFAIESTGPATFRVVRRAGTARGAPANGRSQTVAAADRPDEIVVTGGKRDVPLASYPGSAIVLLPEDGATGPHGASGQSWLLARTAILQSTELGSGRNKLFIRGVADSSFTGPTQSTASTYFGDVRVGYNGPDPNLNLYDVERIEVLEGPQGTLYGAGSIGGIIRLMPRAADLTGAAASIDLGGSATAHGALGYDTAAMVNVAPWRDRVAVRFVGYRSIDGGYIDDPGRGRANVNRQDTWGVRASVRLVPFDGWTIDGGVLHQAGEQPDLQYATTGQPRLQRISAIGQPFEDNYTQLRGVLSHKWANGIGLVGTIGRVAHDTDQRYDATRPGQVNPIAYDERNVIRFTTYEARLSQTRPSGFGWLIGVSQLTDRTAISRTFGMLSATRDLVGVTNRTTEKAAFAELTLPLARGFTLTGGGRYTSARMDGEPSINPVNSNFIRGQTSRRFDPQAGFNWKIGDRFAAFGQFQQGFRTGGLAVARGIGRVATYQADQIKVGEVGLRLLRTGRRGLSAVVAVSVTRWEDIQADLVSRGGFPYTDNVGNGRIHAVEGSLDWAMGGGFAATGGIFLNRSRLDEPAPDYISSGARPLPATPALTATARLEWRRALAVGTLRLAGNARYISHSRLGVGPVLDLRYGNYVQTGLVAALARERIEGSIAIDNLFDQRANRFAIGNPFGIQYRDEITPLRPRTIRIGLSGRF